MDSVRVRFAPSPTGYLHVGGARTALFTWLFARHHAGTFILRIEDTDLSRYQPDALEDIMAGLRWLGLEWDEGPEVGGDFGPYFQSQRLSIYREYAHKLVESGHAYRCYCSRERLDRLRKEQQARKEPPGYDRHCRNLTDKEIAQFESQGITPVIRFKIPLEGQTTFRDLIRGDITVENSTLDDHVLLKSDGYPTYHLANVVDDHLMGISHVTRADEWIPSTPRHILQYQALGWEPPQFAHLPIILAPEGKGKLSKRHGATALIEFKKQGFLPEAMINFLALLGWSYEDGREFFSRDDLIENFDLARVNAAPAAFSYEKLEKINGVYIRNLEADDLAERILPFLREAGLKADPPTVRRLGPLIRERMARLSEVVGLVDFFFIADYPRPDPQLLIGKKMTADQTRRALVAAREKLAALGSFDEGSIEETLRALAQELGLTAGQLFTPIRIAATGKKVAPPLFGTLSILGRERVLDSLGWAISALEGEP
ncbi:MAG: glutamate--tRNA ligase [Anaerolineae bacterium]